MKPVNRIAQFLEDLEEMSGKPGKAKEVYSPVFQRAISHLLESAEISDTDLAQKMKISQGTITNYRDGKCPTYLTKSYRSFCRYFGVVPNQLRKGKIVEAASDPSTDLHAILDDLINSDASDAAELTLRALWSQHVSSSNRKT